MATTKIMCSLEFVRDAIGLPKNCVITEINIKPVSKYMDITLEVSELDAYADMTFPGNSDVVFTLIEVKLPEKAVVMELTGCWKRYPDKKWLVGHRIANALSVDEHKDNV